MGTVRARKRNRHRDVKRSSKTKAFKKDLDQISEILNMPEQIQELDPDLPGLGQFKCRECDVYYTCQRDLDSHSKSKVHKRRVKELKHTYTMEESLAAAGMGVDNGLSSWSASDFYSKNIIS
jgi:bud site selection protein 20